jgi:hypothetical protein
VPGSPKPEPLATNKVAAQQLLAQKVRKAELRKANIFDPFEAHRNRPLVEHLAGRLHYGPPVRPPSTSAKP